MLWFMFMFACSLAFILPWTFVLLAGLVAGLGDDAVTAAFALALLFLPSPAEQAVSMEAKVSSERKHVPFRISVPPDKVLGIQNLG